jgi:hypothetical protein
MISIMLRTKIESDTMMVCLFAWMAARTLC